MYLWTTAQNPAKPNIYYYFTEVIPVEYAGEDPPDFNVAKDPIRGYWASKRNIIRNFIADVYLNGHCVYDNEGITATLDSYKYVLTGPFEQRDDAGHILRVTIGGNVCDARIRVLDVLSEISQINSRTMSPNARETITAILDLLDAYDRRGNPFPRPRDVFDLTPSVTAALSCTEKILKEAFERKT